jgi:hypothetical protein
MNREEVIELVKQYSNETLFMSFTKHDHSAYVKLKAAGSEIIPFLLERLKDTQGRTYGEAFDPDNNPWLLIGLLGEATDGECLATFPEQFAGILKNVTEHILQWGENKNAK